MKIRKSTFKWLAWMLAFFLVTASVAQGVERCGGKCCQGQQEPVVRDPSVVHEPGNLGLPLNPKMPLDAFLPSCHLPGPLGDSRTAGSQEEASQEAPCQDEGAPISCCHLGKAGTGSQALVSQGHSWGTDRLFHAALAVCIQSAANLNEDQRYQSVDGGSLQPRAAPVPLYLKNTSFIC